MVALRQIFMAITLMGTAGIVWSMVGAHAEAALVSMLAFGAGMTGLAVVTGLIIFSDRDGKNED